MLVSTVAEILEDHAREHLDAMRAARAFERACAADDVEEFFRAVDSLNTASFDAWRLAMRRVGKLPAISDAIRAAFLNVWVESKRLPLRVGNRRVLADALRLLMPGGYAGAPLRLYRGANWQERRRHRYGFSWTQQRETAHGFAEHWAHMPPVAYPLVAKYGLDPKEIARHWGGGGVVLETVAPAEAVLLVREKEGYYDEEEVVVDPFSLGPITVAERLRP